MTAPKKLTPPPPFLSTGKKKVLVVDNDALILIILSSFHSESHYEVETAENGKQAFTALDDYFDLLLSDLEMPEMGGLYLLESLRKSKNNIFVVTLTGNQEIFVALNALKLGPTIMLLRMKISQRRS